MIRSFGIENFKSIVSETIELGRFNIFIGPNGSGKTNVLEALAMAAACMSSRIAPEDLLLRGVRTTRPTMTLSAFTDPNPNNNIKLTVVADFEGESTTFDLNLRAPGAANGAGPSDAWHSSRFVHPGPILMKKIKAHLKELNARLQKLPPEERALEQLNQDRALPFRFEEILDAFGIYAAETPALRGLGTSSHREPVGLHGENLDVFLTRLAKEETGSYQLAVEKTHLISWFSDVLLDETDALKLEGHKSSQNTSRLYLRDKYLANPANVLAAENANEGVLHLLFYLTLFASTRTPSVFAIDNIETGLNPKLCTRLVEELAHLAKDRGKQAVVVTHSPAVLDGLNLHDDDERLFEVHRDDDGHTRVKRIKLKPSVTVDNKRLKLSELWMRGHLGGIPTNF